MERKTLAFVEYFSCGMNKWFMVPYPSFEHQIHHLHVTRGAWTLDVLVVYGHRSLLVSSQWLIGALC